MDALLLRCRWIDGCIDKIDKLDWIDVAQDRIRLDKSRYG